MAKCLPAMRETWVQSLGQEDPLEKEMATTPIFLPGKSHGRRSLAGYSPRGHKELDTTDWTAAYSRQNRQTVGLTDVNSATLSFRFLSVYNKTSVPPWVQSQIKGFTYSPMRTTWPPCPPKWSDTDGSADMKEMTSICKEASLDPQLAPQTSVWVGL